jgi:hypothetical protein
MRDIRNGVGTDGLQENSDAALGRFNRPRSLQEERAMRREMVAAILGLIGILALIGWALTQ